MKQKEYRKQMNRKVNDIEVISVINWIIGYVSVIQGHERLKEEVMRLDNLLWDNKIVENIKDETKRIQKKN